MARISRRALPFLPLMRDAEAQVERPVELHADDAATQVRDPDSLATALVVLAAAAPAPLRATVAGLVWGHWSWRWPQPYSRSPWAGFLTPSHRSSS